MAESIEDADLVVIGSGATSNFPEGMFAVESDMQRQQYRCIWESNEAFSDQQLVGVLH